MPTKEQADWEAAKTRRELLASEAAAVLLLRRSLRVQLSESPRPSRPEHVVSLLNALTGRWARDVYQSRRDARQRGAQRLINELHGFDVKLSATGIATGETAAHDRVRAGRAATWLSDRFAKRVAKAGPEDIGRAVRVAADKAASDFTTTASFENATAFNQERRALASAVPDVQFLRVWDAQLDQSTCPDCWNADGTIVALNEPFPGGLNPGWVHGRCRCIDVIIPAEFSALYSKAA